MYLCIDLWWFCCATIVLFIDYLILFQRQLYLRLPTFYRKLNNTLTNSLTTENAQHHEKKSQNYIYTQPKEIQIEKYAIHQSSRVLYIFPLIQLFIIRNRWWASLRIFVGMYGVLQNILYKMQRCNPRLEIKKISILLASP